MTILIIGGAGFIGSHLVDYYLKLGEKIIVIDNLSTGKLSNIKAHQGKSNFTFYEADALEWPGLEDTLTHCDIIYDLAAVVGMFNVLEKPIATLHTNISITERLLSLVAGLKNKPLIIIASSSEVYGSSTTPMQETDSLSIQATNKSHASYPISKLCNEVMGMAYHKEKKIPVIILRIFNTIGPKQSARYGMVLPRFIQQALKNEPLTIFSNGKQTRTFCDVRDMCHMFHQLAISTKGIGEIINVGGEKAISIIELADKVKMITCSKSTYHFQSFAEVYGEDYINIEERAPNLNKLKSIINYERRWTLEATIDDMIDSMQPVIDKK